MTEFFPSYDGTRLAYQVQGSGSPLVCLPGGPGRNPAYLGDLGGVGKLADRELVFLELRGTGTSAVPADPAMYRCDRMTEDVEALRAHLGLDQMDLLGHSAGGDLALLYAVRYPDRIGRLILLNPALHSVGLAVTIDELLANMQVRSAEPWYPGARAAAEAAFGGDESEENRRSFLPFFYGRWDEAARAHAAGESDRVPAVMDGYYAAGAFDPPQTRALLAKVIAPVLVLTGDLDLGPTPERAAEAAALFPAGEVAVLPGAAHTSWLDDPAGFAAALAGFLGSS
jgi:pimeloyl-ACP methyl ester carboxylesterase